MAIRFDALTEKYSRSSSPVAATFTVMGWFKISVDRDAYTGFICVSYGGGGGPEYFVGAAADGTTLISYNNLADGPNGSALSVGTWYHVAMVRLGSGASDLVVYLNGVQDTTHSGDTAGTIAGIAIGARFSDNSDWLNGCAAAVKLYDTTLSANEIAQEMRQYLPVRTANLNSFYPLLSTADDEIDYSGAGLTLSIPGGTATEDGPPIPWARGRRRAWSFGGVTPRFILGTH